MRKALMGFILAATAMVPVSAQAQRWQRGDNDRGSHSRDQNGGEDRSSRYEARHQEQSQPQQPQQQQQQQVVQTPREDRGGRGGWNRGGDNNNQGGGNQGGGWNRGGNYNNDNARWRRGGGDNNDGARWNRNGGDGDRRTRSEQPSIYPQAWQGDPNDPRLQHYRELERRNQNQGYDRRGDRDGRRDWRGDRDGRRGDRNWRNDWNRGWRNDNRYNWSSWRNQNRYRYHLSPYYSPYRNWSYRRFSVGLFLDSLFYDQRYWIGDPWQYRLPPAPYGTQWVRYYDDVLLVDIYTGEVVDVIYNFFW